jgi:hypothetical protein
MSKSKRRESERKSMLEREIVSENPEANDERPCLHCLIADLINEFYTEYGSLSGEMDSIDVDEIVMVIAKIVADMTFNSDSALRRRILEELTREIARFQAEFEAEDADVSGSEVRH